MPEIDGIEIILVAKVNKILSTYVSINFLTLKTMK